MSKVKCPGCNQRIPVNLDTMTGKCEDCNTEVGLKWTWIRPDAGEVRKPDHMITVKIAGQSGVGKTVLKKMLKNALIDQGEIHDFLIEDMDSMNRNPISTRELTKDTYPAGDGKLRHIVFIEEEY